MAERFLDVAGLGLRTRNATVGRYSRRVRWMKVALPLLALGLVAAIFFAGRSRDPSIELLTAEEIATLSAGLRLEAPRIAGRTDGGEPFVLRADWASPDGPAPDRIALEKPSGDLQLSGGRLVEGRSATGLLLRSQGRMWLEGGVVIESSDGYRMESERVEIDLDRRELASPGAVFGHGPPGAISAGSMQILNEPPAQGGEAAAEPDPKTARILFEDRVRVLFIPRRARGTAAEAEARAGIAAWEPGALEGGPEGDSRPNPASPAREK